jgi:hypothetical protein
MKDWEHEYECVLIFQTYVYFLDSQESLEGFHSDQVHTITMFLVKKH